MSFVVLLSFFLRSNILGGRFALGRSVARYPHIVLCQYLVTVLERHDPPIVRVEDLVKVRHEQRENTSRDAERGREYDAHIARCHLVDICIVHNLDQMGSQSTEKCVVGLGQTGNQACQLVHSFSLRWQFYCFSSKMDIKK